MTYPLSNPVNVGDPTEADQYNNLRTDALYLGNDPAASGTLRDLLCQAWGTITLARISGTEIRLSASASAAAAVTIGGIIHAVTEDLILTVSAVDFPDPGRYAIYAAADDGPGFTLSAGTVPPSNSREIGSFVWTGDGIIPGTVKTTQTREIIRAARNLQAANGRLTLASGTPVPEMDITNGQTLYYTPCGGNEIGLYLAGEWELFTFSELSLGLNGLQREIPYDIFIGADKSGLYLEKVVWGSASARLTALTVQDGVPVLVTNPQLRYLGTIALNSSGYCEDAINSRLVWNQENRTARPLLSQKKTATAGTAENGKWVPGYGTDTPEVRLLIPNADTDFELSATAISTVINDSDAGYSRGVLLGIGQDMVKVSPFTGNTNCAPVYCHSFGNSPMTVRISNTGSEFRGFHTYTMAFWTNYNYVLSSTSLAGEIPGMAGKIYA